MSNDITSMTGMINLARPILDHIKYVEQGMSISRRLLPLDWIEALYEPATERSPQSNTILPIQA